MSQFEGRVRMNMASVLRGVIGELTGNRHVIMIYLSVCCSEF